MENKEKSTKICKTCNKEKPIYRFRLVKGKYHISHCDKCKTEMQREYQKAYREANKKDLKTKALSKVKSDEPIERRVSSIYCGIRACSEHKGEHYGLIKYCKSHAFDKLHNIKII